MRKMVDSLLGLPIEVKRAIVAQVFGKSAGAVSTGIVETLFVGLILVYVGFMVVGQFSGIIGNITSPEGIVGTFFDMGKWLIPVLAVVALIVYALTHWLGGGSRGGGGRKRSRK